MNIKWDAQKYTSDFSFVAQYGSSLIDMIETEKPKTVLDLGCGNGILTNALSEKGFNAIGLDASEELLNIARDRYPSIEFINADATSFTLNKPVDVIFSNAVFHWIDRDRQEDMLKHVHSALKKDGEFIFEFGGYKNNQLIHSVLKKVFSKYGYSYEIPFYFPTIGEYATLLEKNGFKVVYALLFDRPTPLKGENGLKDWINMFLKTPFETVSAEDREKIITEAVEELRDDLFYDNIWHSDYVRLRMKATSI